VAANDKGKGRKVGVKEEVDGYSDESNIPLLITTSRRFFLKKEYQNYVYNRH